MTNEEAQAPQAEPSTKEAEQEKPAQHDDKGSQPQTTSIIDNANAAAERLAKENEKFEENISRLERLRAFEKLGGKSVAGDHKENSTESKAQEEADRALKRFGLK